MRTLVIATAVAAGAWPVTCRAQTPDSGGPSTPNITITAGYEARVERLRYEFQNPSNIDTPFLVPHSFAQTYWASNSWFVASARYALLQQHFESEFSFTLERETSGHDLDTFHDPNDDVVISGTKGDVLMRSWRFVQWSEGKVQGLPLRVGLVYRKDRAEFLPADRILTHSNPPSETRSLTFGREETFSQILEIPIDVSKPIRVGSRWRLVPGANISPLMRAKLTTLLPDKYPGKQIVFAARVIGLDSRIQVVRGGERRLFIFAIHYTRTWSYRASEQFAQNALQLSARIGFER